MISRKNAKIILLASLCGLMISAPYMALAAGFDSTYSYGTCVSKDSSLLHPSTWGGIVTNVIPCAIYSILFLIFNVINYGIATAAWFIQLILGYTSSLMSLPTIRVGFDAMLMVANLVFVFAIIVIAVSTILDYERYGMKQLLWKLIVAALLVNFSFLFAGILVNVSNGTTFYFVKEMTGSTADNIGLASVLGDKLVAAFSPESLVTPPTSSDNVSGGGGGFIATVESILFGIVFAMLILFLLLAIAIMFLIRYIYIAFLIILAPIVWAFWVLPSTAKYFERWWSEFLRWCFFAPICIFFLYLAMYTGVHRKDYLENASYDPNVSAAAGLSTSATTAVKRVSAKSDPAFRRISDMLIILGLAYGGLMVANAFSIEGAKAGMAGTKAGMKGLGKWGGRTTVKLAGGAIGAAAVAGPALGRWGKSKFKKPDIPPPPPKGPMPKAPRDYVMTKTADGTYAHIPPAQLPPPAAGGQTGGPQQPPPPPSGGPSAGGPTASPSVGPTTPSTGGPSAGGSNATPSAETAAPPKGFFGTVQSTWRGAVSGARTANDISQLKGAGTFYDKKIRPLDKGLLNSLFVNKESFIQSTFGKAYLAATKSRRGNEQKTKDYSEQQLRAYAESGVDISKEVLRGLSKTKREILKEYSHLRAKIEEIENESGGEDKDKEKEKSKPATSGTESEKTS